MRATGYNRVAQQAKECLAGACGEMADQAGLAPACHRLVNGAAR